MEVCTIGGFEQVGKNMTAVKVRDDVFLFDSGLDIPGIVELQEEAVLEYTHRLKKGGKRLQQYTEKKLREFGAIPDDLILDKLGWRDKVRAIFISHAHLDHVGAVPYIANRYPKATIYATPFTMKVLEAILEDEKMRIRNRLKIVQSNSSQIIKGKSGSYNVEFIHATHSTLQCAFIALHTPEGTFFYALDFKLDNYPTMGRPPNYKRLKELGKKGVKVLVMNSLYSGSHRKTPSERVARHLVEDAISSLKNAKGALIITTFSSHIERLSSIVEFAQRTRREIVFLGRSLGKYVEAASKANSCPFKNKVRLIKFAKQRESFLRKLDKNRGKYFIVCTGHQAEENSILDRIVRGNTPFHFKEGDHIIFSSTVIPAPVNIAARDKLDKKLIRMGVRLKRDIHVSGHGSREDMRDLVQMLRPKHIIPAHGTLQQETPMIELASEMGYTFGKTSHLSPNGNVLKF